VNKSDELRKKGAKMRILTYEEYLYICRTVVESCTGCNTEGAIHDGGKELHIGFGIPQFIVIVNINYDEQITYWKPEIEFGADIRYGDKNAWIALELLDRMKGTILELAEILSDCRVDYWAAYEAGNFKQYEWKLLSGKKSIVEQR
jgi:hypothetical protein